MRDDRYDGSFDWQTPVALLILAVAYLAVPVLLAVYVLWGG